MKKKILLVYPEIPTTYWSYKYSISFVGKKALLPPLGLLTVAALLPENYECKLVDMNITHLLDEDILSADLIFVSAMLVQKNSFEKVVESCNRLGKTVVAGGPYPTSSHEKISGVTHFVLNEGEITLPKFLADYEKGNMKRVYTDETKPDITATPIPKWELLDISKYFMVSLQYSRGCPFNCEFCDIIEMFGRKPRSKTPGQFMDEINSVYRLGFRGTVFIVDDNFIGNKQKVKELLREIIPWQKERNYPFNFNTEASINLADDDELLGLLAEAKFSSVFIGIETPVEKSLELSGKSQNLKSDLLASIEKIQRRGIEVAAGFIIGFDTDPEDIFDLQLKFIKESAIPVAMIGLLMALPKTRLYRRLTDENRILEESTGNNTHNVELNFIPVLPKKVLISGYRRVIGELYTAKNFYARCLELLRRFPSQKKANRKISFDDIKALFKSIIVQGLSPNGLEYIKFLFRAFLIKPSLFPNAVAMTIEGYHFFKITEEILSADNFKSYLEEEEEKFFSKRTVEMIGQKNSVSARWNIALSRTSLRFKTKRRYQVLGSVSRSYVREALSSFETNVNRRSNEIKRTMQ